MVTKQLGPGMFQQFQTQECEQCSNVKYARESETLQVKVEPGMQDKEVSRCILFGLLLGHASVLQPLSAPGASCPDVAFYAHDADCFCLYIICFARRCRLICHCHAA